MTISPANGWFFVFPNNNNSGYPLTFMRIAVWRSTEEGQVEGLLSFVSNPQDGRHNTLVATPNVKGWYVHENDLPDDDKIQIKEVEKKNHDTYKTLNN